MEKNKKSYFAIIPANVRYDDKICANAKLLYGEITALCNEKGYCWATNDYFAKLYQVSKTSISKWIKQLLRAKYINTKLIYKNGSKQILHRYITIIKDPIEEKLNIPIEEKLKDNSTLINNTINNRNTDKIDKKYVELANIFFQNIKYNVNPISFRKYTSENINSLLLKWAEEFRKMMMLDKIKQDEIVDVINWTVQHNFWANNILSAKKLRKQFDTLYLQMKNEKKNIDYPDFNIE